jgi:hypothetical protein
VNLLLDTNGYIQLDDIYGEDVLQEFVQCTYLKLRDHELMGQERLSRLVNLVKENPPFSSFKECLRNRHHR